MIRKMSTNRNNSCLVILAFFLMTSGWITVSADTLSSQFLTVRGQCSDGCCDSGFDSMPDPCDGVYENCSPAPCDFTMGGPVGPCNPCGSVLDSLTVFGGVTGFKGELDGGMNGNFGIFEGFNWSTPLTSQGCVMFQAGFRAVQSNLNGMNYIDPISEKMVHFDKCRRQYFVTTGLIKRHPCEPIQGGAVFDWCHDDLYGTVELQQIRYELSTVPFGKYEFGFEGGVGISKSRSDRIGARENALFGTGRGFYVKAQDYYLGFVRKYTNNGGLLELKLGGTEYGDFVFSGKGEVPFHDCLSFLGSVTTVVPKQGNTPIGSRRETWEVSVGMVIYFHGGAQMKRCNPTRPMFDVAGNGTFLNRIFGE